MYLLARAAYASRANSLLSTTNLPHNASPLLTSSLSQSGCMYFFLMVPSSVVTKLILKGTRGEFCVVQRFSVVYRRYNQLRQWSQRVQETHLKVRTSKPLLSGRVDTGSCRSMSLGEAHETIIGRWEAGSCGRMSLSRGTHVPPKAFSMSVDSLCGTSEWFYLW